MHHSHAPFTFASPPLTLSSSRKIAAAQPPGSPAFAVVTRSKGNPCLAAAATRACSTASSWREREGRRREWKERCRGEAEGARRRTERDRCIWRRWMLGAAEGRQGHTRRGDRGMGGRI